jgi:molybdate transport system regulatory protein
MRQAGGRRGGGAQLTPLGEAIIAHFREAEAAIASTTQEDLAALQAEVQHPVGN